MKKVRENWEIQLIEHLSQLSLNELLQVENELCSIRDRLEKCINNYIEFQKCH